MNILVVCSRDPDAEKDDANGKKTKAAGGRLKRARGQGVTEEEDADEDDDEELDEQHVTAPNSKAATKKAKVRCYAMVLPFHRQCACYVRQ